MKVNRSFFLTSSLLALVIGLNATTVHAQNSAIAQTGTVVWICNAFYLPARSIWKRTVAIDYGTEGVRAVVIDGVPAYSFSVIESSVLTAVDGERIQFDATAQTWSSDLRGVVSSQGRCER